MKKSITSIRQIKLGDSDFNYLLRNNYRSKSLRLTIRHDGTLVVSKPRFVPLFALEKYLKEKADWILEKSAYFKRLKLPSHEQNHLNYLRAKKPAKLYIYNKVAHFNRLYNFSYNRIAIKNQRTCWGSCSKKANLNFNWKIINLPETLADLIIVHELCHLKEFNHSQRFWDLVAMAIPDYKIRRLELKRNQIKTLI